MRELLEFIGQSTLPEETKDSAFMDGDRYHSDQLNFLTFIDLFDERGRSVTTPEEMRSFLSSVAEESGMNDITMGRVAQYAYKVGRISKDQLSLIEQGLKAGEVRPLALTDEMKAGIRHKIDAFKARQLERKLREVVPDPEDTGTDSEKRTDTFADEGDPEADEAPGVPAGEEDNPEEPGAEGAEGGEDLGTEAGIAPEASVGPEGGSAGAPPEGEEEPEGEIAPEKPEQAERPLEVEFIGMNKDKALSYTLKRVFSPEGEVTDLQVIDQMETPVMSASKEGLDKEDVAGFLKQAILTLDMDDGVSGIIKKYDLFGIEAAEQERMKELEGEPGEEDEVPGEMDLPKAETKPGDFGHGEDIFNPMTNESLDKLIEAAAKAEGGDWKSVLDRNGIDPDSRFRAGNRVFFRCSDPALAQSVAAQLGARLDGTVSYEGLEFVRAVLEGCAGHSPEGKKWMEIRKHMTKAEISRAAKKAAKTRASESSTMVDPNDMRDSVVEDPEKDGREWARQGKSFSQAYIHAGLVYKEAGESLKAFWKGFTEEVEKVVSEAWDDKSALAYSKGFKLGSEGQSLQDDSDKSFETELERGEFHRGHDHGSYCHRRQAAGKSAGEGELTEDSKILASGITDQALANQIASTKKGKAILDPNDATKTKWIVISQEEEKL